MKKFFALLVLVSSVVINARRLSSSVSACTFGLFIQRVLVARYGPSHRVTPLAMYFDSENGGWHLFAYDENAQEEVDISISESSEFCTWDFSGCEEDGQGSEDS